MIIPIFANVAFAAGFAYAFGATDQPLMAATAHATVAGLMVWAWRQL